MRPEILRLLELGSLPTEDDDDDPRSLDEYDELFTALKPSIADEEAVALLALFGPEDGDSCYGLAWTLLHLIETAPSWPGAPAVGDPALAIEMHLQRDENPWVRCLWQRILNARELENT